MQVVPGTLIAFTGYLLYILTFYPKLPSNYDSVMKSVTWPHHIVFNLFFSGITILAVIKYRAYKIRYYHAPP